MSPRPMPVAAPRPAWPAALLAAAVLAGCATTLPPTDAPTPAAPAQWSPTPAQAALPHGGRRDDLQQWWRQFDDPLLPDLVDAAQGASPNVASALSRIEQARASRVAATASLLPSLDAEASAARGRFDLFTPEGTRLGANLNLAWELDLFGAGRAGRDAAQARLEGAAAEWHDARVLVAAEVGQAYVGLRACEAQLEVVRADAASRAEVARLTAQAANAGFRPPAAAELARASAAQGRYLSRLQQQVCDSELKALVALTGIDEPALRQRMAASPSRLPRPASIAVADVPAQVLNQRPDLYAGAQRVVAAAQDTAQAQALRYPRVGLVGYIGAARYESGPLTLNDTLWSVGPVQISLPLFDAGTRAANVVAARARYDEAVSQYAAQVRQAVREVEDALLSLQGTQARAADADDAVAGFEASLRATQALYGGGLASLFELEDARRNALVARRELIDLERERVFAWIALYRALGGGWSASADDVPRTAAR
jgi:NodT family efflux transporter outer membrane factor (OMF) lipoprotein